MRKKKHFIQLPFFLLSRAKGKFIYSISMLFLCAFMRSFHIFYDVRENLLPLLLPQLMNVAFSTPFSTFFRAEKVEEKLEEIDFQE